MTDLQATFWPGGQVPSDGHLAWWGPDDPAVAGAALGLPVGEPAQFPTVLPASVRARKKVMTTEVPARVVSIRLAVRALAALAPADAWPTWQRPSDSVLAWSLAAKIALELTAAGRLVPVVRPAGDGIGIAHWRAVVSEDARIAAVADAFPPAAHALVTDEDDDVVWSAHGLLDAFFDAVADVSARSRRPGITDPSSARTVATASATTKAAAQASPAGAWIAALTGTDPVIDLPAGSVEDLVTWAAPVFGDRDESLAHLCVQLHTPDADDPGAPWPLDFHLRAADDPSLMVPADQVWSTSGPGNQVLGRNLGDPQDVLVRGLAEAARLFTPIDASLSEQCPAGIALSPTQAADFLSSGAQALAGAGLGVMLPAELTAKGARKLRARLRIATPVSDPGAGIVDGGLDADGLAAFRWEAAIGDDALSPEEFAEIVALKTPLVQWRGQWVHVEAGDMPRLADLVEHDGKMSGAEALSVALSGVRDTHEFGEVDVVVGGVFADLVQRLREGAGAGTDPDLTGIEATLRDYQGRGAAWLQAMSGIGLGTVLADDMGLGKTLQTISLLASRGGLAPHLVVCPTSVVGNWERELARFAPGLVVRRHHGSDRASTADEFGPGEVVITSYGLMRRDIDLLADVDWNVVVLDEAQQIKNQAAQSARAARRLGAQARVALTGTPVENRLSELWSIMEFANPGLLGPFTSFRESYAVPVERWADPDATARLRRIVAPFMLRRVKSDPAVAADLPAKQESIVGGVLTREQVTLYEATVRALLDDEGLGEGIERRGRILKLLTALKQICNHPAQFLGERGPLHGRSGKLARVTEMLGEIAAEGEHAVVFTQYREMGEMLSRHFAAEFGLADVPFLHGGVARTKRDAMVEEFQNAADAPPILVVSLKAGGTGLNLTRATHVMHYDRWWNPAVEDQATDRTYRIGQTRPVNVYKLVTEGTVEERVSGMLDEKRALADAVVGSGETWLTEMSDDDLRCLVELSSGDRSGAADGDAADEDAA